MPAAFTTAVSLHEEALNSAHSHGTAADLSLLQTAGARLSDLVVEGALDLPPLTLSGFAERPDALESFRTGAFPGKRVVLV